MTDYQTNFSLLTACRFVSNTNEQTSVWFGEKFDRGPKNVEVQNILYDSWSVRDICCVRDNNSDPGQSSVVIDQSLLTELNRSWCVIMELLDEGSRYQTSSTEVLPFWKLTPRRRRQQLRYIQTRVPAERGHSVNTSTRHNTVNIVIWRLVITLNVSGQDGRGASKCLHRYESFHR